MNMNELSQKGEPEAVARRCSIKKVFLKILPNSQGTPVAESFFNKVAGLKQAKSFQLHDALDVGL